MNKYNEEQIGQSQFFIPQYNLSLLFCILNMYFPSYTVAEISLTKKCREKEKWINLGRINRRKLVFNPTMQQIIVNLHTNH